MACRAGRPPIAPRLGQQAVYPIGTASKRLRSCGPRNGRSTPFICLFPLPALAGNALLFDSGKAGIRQIIPVFF